MIKLEERRASIQPIKSKLKISILDDGDVKKINETALNIIEEIGVVFPSEKALKIFSDADDCAFKIANLYYKAKKERRYKILSLFNSYHGTLRGTGGATGLLKGACAECPPCGLPM